MFRVGRNFFVVRRSGIRAAWAAATLLLIAVLTVAAAPGRNAESDGRSRPFDPATPESDGPIAASAAVDPSDSPMTVGATAGTATASNTRPFLASAATATTGGRAATDSEGDLLFGPTDRPASDPELLSYASPFETVLRIMTSLVVVIAAILGISWWVQRRSGLHRAAFGRTLGILPLDRQHFLYLVEIFDRVLVLGVTDHSIQLICEITDRTTLDALRLDPRLGGRRTESDPRPGQPRFAFLDRARSLFGLATGEGGGDAEIEHRTAATREQVERIQELLLRRGTGGDQPGTPAGGSTGPEQNR